MRELTLRSSTTFPVYIVGAIMSSWTIITKGTTAVALPNITWVLLAIIPQGRQLIVVQFMGMRVFAFRLSFVTTVWVEVVIVARSRLKLLERKINGYIC